MKSALTLSIATIALILAGCGDSETASSQKDDMSNKKSMTIKIAQDAKSGQSLTNEINLYPMLLQKAKEIKIAGYDVENDANKSTSTKLALGIKDTNSTIPLFWCLLNPPQVSDFVKGVVSNKNGTTTVQTTSLDIYKAYAENDGKIGYGGISGVDIFSLRNTMGCEILAGAVISDTALYLTKWAQNKKEFTQNELDTQANAYMSAVAQEIAQQVKDERLARIQKIYESSIVNNEIKIKDGFVFKTNDDILRYIADAHVRPSYILPQTFNPIIAPIYKAATENIQDACRFQGALNKYACGFDILSLDAGNYSELKFGQIQIFGEAAYGISTKLNVTLDSSISTSRETAMEKSRSGTNDNSATNKASTNAKE